MWQFLLFTVLAVSVIQSEGSYSLIDHLQRQAYTLLSGVDLAIKLGNLGYLNEQRIAFSAKPASIYKTSSGSRVMFNYQQTNEGNRYQTSSSYFYAYKPGLYVFMWSIRAYRDRYSTTTIAHTYLTVNKDVKVYSYCNSGYSNYYDSCTQTAVLQLHAYDKVSIQAGSTFKLDPKYSSFIGYKLV